MSRRFVVLLAFLAVLSGPLALVALGQGSTTSSLAGTVVDKDGGVVPGVTVVVKNNATAVSLTTTTNSTGNFSVPALNIGVYTVTISLNGFKTVVLNNVKLIAGTPADLNKITLEVGNLTDTINVRAGTDLVQTQSAAVSSTLSANQIASLPVVTQNGSAFIANLPGVDTAAGGHSIRSSSINGLPQSAINITLDGINDQDNSNKSTDGFWAMVHPKLDQVEEVTVTGAVPGADSSGQGAVTIKWVTRSGTSRYEGSGYEYFRHWALNSNYYFNKVNGLPRNEVQLNQFGFREGGPLVRNKVFFFVNEEEFRRPASATNTRTILSPLAQSGVFQYNTTSGVASKDLLALAATSGFTTAADPTVMGLLNRIRTATTTTGNVLQTSDPNVMSYVYQGSGGRIEHNPTGRVDVNLSERHRLSGTYNWQEAFQHPDLLNGNDPTFPGFANFADQTSYRNLMSATLRSTLRPNLINEAVGGFLWSPIDFSGPVGPSQFADQGGFSLTLPLGLTSGTITNTINQRNASHWDLSDTLNWITGKHAFQFGGTFTQVNYWTQTQTAVPTVSFGVDTANDPANSMFTAANFPGSSTGDMNNARSLYGLLTGRVTQIGGNIRLDAATNQYKYLGLGRQNGQMNEFGMFAQDSWRLTPTLTATGGLRWEVQLPFHPTNSLFSTASLASFCGVSGTGSNETCNLFQPGTLTGSVTTYSQYSAGAAGYHTDWNNFAPTVGLAWRPNAQSGILRTILGDPQQATIRGGYAVAYNRDSIGSFTGPFANNPGLSITENRNATTGLLVVPGDAATFGGNGWPLLLSQSSRTGAPPFCSSSVTTLCMPQTPAYPIAASLSNSVNIFDPNFEVAHSTSYTLGLQRAISKDMVVEVRYVGTRNHDGLTNQNLNETVVVENGFANEFKLAQANLQSNIANGRGNTFAYFGAGTGTSPLPIYLAHFNGVPASQASDQTKYTGANWTNTTQVGQIGQILAGTPITTAANGLASSATFRASMLQAGLASNFWTMNPDVSAANMTRSISTTKYDSVQFELRRRLANGFFITGNYTFGSRFSSASDTLRRPLLLVQDTAGVRHAFKLNWTYEIPVGRGRRFMTNTNQWLNGFLGGWEFDGVGRVQSGNLLDFGNVKVVGMTLGELQDAYHVQFRPNPTTGVATVYMLPQEIIDNTIKAFSVSATSANGYGALGAPTGRYLAPANDGTCVQIVRGDCAPRSVFVYGPAYARFDFSLRKTFPLGGRRSFQLEGNVLNVFNSIGFNAVAQASNNANINIVTSAYTDVSNTFDPGGRLGQMVFRINW